MMGANTAVIHSINGQMIQMIRKTNVHTVNGHKYRNVEELVETPLGDIWVVIDYEVLTPCGWKNEDVYCGHLCDHCRIGNNMKEMIEM